MDNDGGYRSRKLHLAYVVIFLMVMGFFAVGKWPSLGVAYGEFCMSLLGAASIYSGSNAMVKWLTKPKTVKKPKKDEKAP